MRVGGGRGRHEGGTQRGSPAPLNIAPTTHTPGHSYGQYVFDQAWANAAARAGIRYYPKLLACVPFAPVTGPRLIVAPGAAAGSIRAALAAGLAADADAVGLSGAHANFVTPDDAAALGGEGFALRTAVQVSGREAEV